MSTVERLFGKRYGFSCRAWLAVDMPVTTKAQLSAESANLVNSVKPRMREFLRKMKNLLNIERFLNAFAPLPAEPLFESYIRFDLRNRLARFSVADRIVGSRRRQSTLYLVSKKGILTHRFCFGTSDNPGSQVWRLNANLKRGDIYLHNEPRSGNDVHVALH